MVEPVVNTACVTAVGSGLMAASDRTTVTAEPLPMPVISVWIAWCAWYNPIIIKAVSSEVHDTVECAVHVRMISVA